MPRKRVAINISVPNQAFKNAVVETNKILGTESSEEFVKVYKRLFKKAHLQLPPLSHEVR